MITTNENVKNSDLWSAVKTMQCNVICTFDKFDEDYEKQEFLDFQIDITEDDKNLEDFIINKLFNKIAEALKKRQKRC